jgi:hypothetical protein
VKQVKTESDKKKRRTVARHAIQMQAHFKPRRPRPAFPRTHAKRQLDEAAPRSVPGQGFPSPGPGWLQPARPPWPSRSRPAPATRLSVLCFFPPRGEGAPEVSDTPSLREACRRGRAGARGTKARTLTGESTQGTAVRLTLSSCLRSGWELPGV